MKPNIRKSWACGTTSSSPCMRHRMWSPAIRLSPPPMLGATRQTRLRCSVLAVAFLVLVQPATTVTAAALTFDDAVAAYRSGDYATAYSVFNRLALDGNGVAQTYLGFMHQDGRGVAQDDTEAVKWYRRAAEQGDAEAQHNLGIMYASGRGVAQDDAEAVKWYRRAAEQSDTEAQYNLGSMYVRGRGVAQDDAKAAEWYRRAAEQNLAPAQTRLGSMGLRWVRLPRAGTVRAVTPPNPAAWRPGVPAASLFLWV